MANISYTKVGGTTYPLSLPYCVCGTTASTAAKTADLANFSLDEGTTVHVKFTNANTATTPTLNINGTGAKGIKAYGTTTPSVNWKAGAVVEFVYDGTNYVMTNVGAIPDGACTVSGGGLSKGTASGGGLSGGGLSGGGLTADAGEVSITQDPFVQYEVTGSIVGKTVCGVTTTQPSGTDGTNYLTITPKITTTAGKVKGRGKVNRAAVTRAQVTRATFTQSVTRADIKDAHTAGYIPSKAATTVIGSTSETVTLGSGSIAADSTTIGATSAYSNWSSEATINWDGNFGGNYYIKAGSCSVTGGGLSKGTASGGALSGGALSGGGLSAGAGAATITTAPVVTPNIGGTVVGKTAYGVTTTKPSGTDGTNYFTLDPGATVTTAGTVKGKGTVSRATINRAQVDRSAFSQSVTRADIKDAHTGGYIADKSATTVISGATETVSLAAGKIDAASIASASQDSNWSSGVSVNPSIGNGTNYYVPVVTATATNGTASASATITKAAGSTITASSATITVSGMTTTTTATSYKIIASANSGFAKAWSGKAKANASATGGSASVGAGITSGASASGTSTGAKSAETTESTAQTTAQSAATTIYIPAGVCTVAGGGLSKGTASGGGLSGGGLSGGGLTASTGQATITTEGFAQYGAYGSFVGKTVYGITTTKPSGTDGTNYLTVASTISLTAPRVKGRGQVSRAAVTRAKINRAAFSQDVTRANITDAHTAGYIPDKSATTVIGSTVTTVSLAADSIAADSTTIGATSAYSNWSSEATVNVDTNVINPASYIPIVTATATGGSASASATITKAAGSTITASSATITTSGITTSTTATSYVVVAKANSGYAKAWSGVAKANASANGGSASVGTGITSGATASGTSTGAKSARTTESTTQTTAQSASATIYIPAGVCTVAGGGLSKGTASGGTLTGGTLSNSMSDLSAWGVNSMGVGAGTTTAPGSGAGYYVAISGYATATRGAVSRATFTQSVTRAAVTDAHTAGYIPDKAATTVISAATETVALGSGSLASTTIASATLTKYYKIPTGSCTVGGGGLSKGTASGGGLSGGTLNSGSGEVSITANPVVTPSIGGTVVGKTAYGVTTTKPSGTDGTNYFTIDPGASVTEGKAKGRGTVTRDAVSRAAFSQKVTRANITDAHTAGYIPDKAATTVIASASETVSLAADTTTIPYASKTSSWSSESSTSSTVTAGTNYYVPVVTATATGGSASASATITKAAWSTITASSATITTSGITTSETATSYVIVAKANSGFAKAGSGVAKANASANGGSASVGAGITTGATASGTSTGAKSAQTTESTAQTTAQTAAATIYLPAGTASVISSTYSGVTPTISGTTYTAQVDVTPDVNTGWILSGSGLPGTVKITGTVPTQMKTATGSGVITPDSGKLLSGVTVSIPNGSATVAAATVSVTLQSSTGSIGNPTTSPSTASQTNNIVLGTVTTKKPSSGLYLQVSGGVSKQTKSGVATLTKTAGYIAAGTASVSTNIKAGTNTRYYPITVKAGSALVGATTITPNSLHGAWNASSNKYIVSQSGKTVSISGSVTEGWVSTISNGTITLSAPSNLEIAGGTITLNVSTGTSSGTIDSGKKIKISSGYYPSDLYYTAQSGGGGSIWSTWTNFANGTADSTFVDLTAGVGTFKIHAGYDDIFYWGYSPYYYGSTNYGLMNGYMSNITDTTLQVDTDSTNPLRIVVPVKDNNWSNTYFDFGIGGYAGDGNTSTTPWKGQTLTVSGLGSGGGVIIFEVYCYMMDGCYHPTWRYALVSA